MRQKRLLWRIYLSFFGATMVAFAASAWYAAYSVEQFFQDQVTDDLKVRAEIIAKGLTAHLLETEPESIDRYCKELGALTMTRITVVLPDGKVIADAEKEPARMENHGNRPEISAALAGKTGRSIRYSNTLLRRLMYLAIPVLHENKVIAVVRTSLPLAVIDRTLNTLFLHIALGGVIVTALFGLMALYLSKRFSQPLEDMRQVADRLAAGELSARVLLFADDETGALAQSLNKMAKQLDNRLTTIVEQRNEQETVFASMVEGVLVVDREERILHLNPAASRLLGIDQNEALGKSVPECVRNPDLQRFINATLATTTVMETEIVLYGVEERFLQLHGTILKGDGATKSGAVVVLNDITKLKRLETVRRDFVANVSHELKTPITAIKGCVETLAEGDFCIPEEATRFLSMMSRQVGRLEAIIEDLLSLSRIEFGAEQDRIRLTPGSVTEVLRRTVQTFSRPAQEKGITLALECPEGLLAPIDAALLEQAVGNLLDNAIKYSGPKTMVKVTGAIQENGIEIRVIDQGPGIEKKHLSRVFERFYRVDQVRSRSLGGTGLGLSIVRNIARALHGSVGVESIPGKGSTFFIRFPLSSDMRSSNKHDCLVKHPV